MSKLFNKDSLHKAIVGQWGYGAHLNLFHSVLQENEEFEEENEKLKEVLRDCHSDLTEWYEAYNNRKTGELIKKLDSLCLISE